MLWKIPLVLCLSLAGLPAIEAQEYERLLSEGNAHLDQGEFRQAVTAFEAALESGEGNAEEAHLGLALAHYRLGNYGNVVKVTESLLQFAEERAIRADAYNLLGVSLFNKPGHRVEDLERAEEALRALLEMLGDHPSAVDPMYSLAAVLHELDRGREALEILDEILRKELNQDHPTTDRARIMYCQLRSSMGGDPDLEELERRGNEAYRALRPRPEEQPGAESEDPLYVGGVVKAPSKLYGSQPLYPTTLRRARVQGRVIVQAIINRRGCVVNTKVVDGLDGRGHALNESATVAISKWVFKPATLNGLPVEVYYNLTVTFGLK